MQTLLREMSNEALQKYMLGLLNFIKNRQPPDVLGCILLICQDNGLVQFGSTTSQEIVPQMLRELATQIEQQQRSQTG